MKKVCKVENNLGVIGFVVFDETVGSIVSPVFHTEPQAIAFIESSCLDGAYSLEVYNV